MTMLDVNQTFKTALNLHIAGRPGEAEPLYRQILAVNPKHVDSLHLLGVAAHDHGRDQEAFELIGKAIALNGRVADYHCNMGLVLSNLGRTDEAIAHFHRAIALDPRHALTYNNLGNLLTDLGRLPEGETALRRAIAINPNYAEAYYNLGNTLAGLGKLDEAVAHYQRGIALAPNVANAHNNLGTALEQQGKLDEAAAAFRRAIALEPAHGAAHYNLGNILRAKADYAAALFHYKQSLAVRPNSADAWNNMGAVLAEQGDLGAAREAYAKAVEVDPTRAAYHRNLASSKRFEPGDPQLAVMEQLAANVAAVPERERIDLQFALGKGYADVKDYDRSFRHYLLGNKLKRERLAYDDAGAVAYMQRTRDVFSAELLRSKAGGGERASKPIFIVGMPRSGTTLIEQIIASHPQAFGAGELFDLDNIVHSLAGLNGSELRFPEVVPTMSSEQLRDVGTRYVAAITALAPHAQRIADKMPWNFHFPGLIHLALPNARIIHARRDPVDTCLSCFTLLFDGDGNPYTYDLGELGRFYRSYEALMAHWHAVLPPGIMIDVQYEEVVGDLEGEARRIIAHCGLPWDEACLAFHKTRRPVRTSSVGQVRQPIYKSSVGRWRPYREHLRPLLDELGIDGQDEPPTPAPRVLAEASAG